MALSMFDRMLLPNEKKYRVEIRDGDAPEHEGSLCQVSAQSE